MEDDLPFYAHLAKINAQITDQDRQRFGGVGNLFAQFIKLSEHTAIYLPDRSAEKPLPAFVRNLFYYSEFIPFLHDLNSWISLLLPMNRL